MGRKRALKAADRDRRAQACFLNCIYAVSQVWFVNFKSSFAGSCSSLKELETFESIAFTDAASF